MYEKVVDSPPALVWGPNPAPTTSQSIKTTGLNALLRFTANISPTTINTVSLVQTQTKARLTDLDTALPSGAKSTIRIRKVTSATPFLRSVLPEAGRA